MNPLKKFEEWYERRHPIVKGTVVGLPMIPFLVSFGFVLLAVAFSAPDLLGFVLAPFTVSGFAVLLVLVSIYKRLSKNVLGALEVLLFLGFRTVRNTTTCC